MKYIIVYDIRNSFAINISREKLLLPEQGLQQWMSCCSYKCADQYLYVWRNDQPACIEKRDLRFKSAFRQIS